MISISHSSPTARRALILRHSHSGQTARCVDALRDRLAGDGWDVRVRAIEPLKVRPFPWKKGAFLDELPECVLKTPEPLAPIAWESGDLEADAIVLASPVWYLSPSRPMSSFLQSEEARCLRGKQVALVFTCRNMWQCAALWAVERVRAAGASRVTFHVVLDKSPGLISFLNTPLWLLSGKRKWGFLPETGLREGGIESVKVQVARALGSTHGSGYGGTPLDVLSVPSARATRDALLGFDAKALRTWFLPECVGFVLWTLLAKAVRGVSRRSPSARKTALAACAIVMVTAIVTLVPALRLTGRPLLRLLAAFSGRAAARLGALESLSRPRAPAEGAAR